jgi:type II secretory pathway pseudopilin PulG
VRIHSGNRGFSLVEVLVVAGIMMIMMFAMMTLSVNQNSETRSIQDKLAKLELEGTLIRVLSGGGICTFVLSDASQSSVAGTPNRFVDTIDTSTPAALASQVVPIRKIPSGVAINAIALAEVGTLASANSSTLKISAMEFKNFRANGVDQYLADFVVSFDPATIRPVPALTIKNIFIGTNAIDPANAKSILDCSVPKGPGPQLRRFTFTYNPAVPNTTWTVPAGVNGAFVTMAGGGGSGAGWRIVNALFTGHSGGFVISQPVTLIPGETLTITVGAGAISYMPINSGVVHGIYGPPYFIYKRPPLADDGYGGYPGGESKIERAPGINVLACAGGSGVHVGLIDNVDVRAVLNPPNPPQGVVPGNGAAGIDGARTGGGNPAPPAFAAPNRPAAGPYAVAGGPGRCGGLGVVAGSGRGMAGQSHWSPTGLVGAGYWPGGKTPLGFGSGGDVSVSGCHVGHFAIAGICVSPGPGVEGVVHIDVLY